MRRQGLDIRSTCRGWECEWHDPGSSSLSFVHMYTGQQTTGRKTTLRHCILDLAMTL